MAKTKNDSLSLDDLDGMGSPVEPNDMEARLQKIELFMKRFDGSNMNLTDRQVVYHAAYVAILQGMLNFNPSMLKKPDLLYTYLRDAKVAAEMALVVHDGGTKGEFTGEFKLRREKGE
jgi:hypothetical protein